MWRDRLKPFVLGVAGALATALVLALCWSVWILWTRAYNGEVAWEYLLKVQQAQQAQGPQAPSK